MTNTFIFNREERKEVKEEGRKKGKEGGREGERKEEGRKRRYCNIQGNQHMKCVLAI